MEIRVSLPVFVQHQQQFLRTAKSKRREKDMPSSLYDGMHETRKPRLLLVPRFSALYAIRALDDKHIRSYWW
jgi:hypothetical protein